jgi:hypothetical protein
MSPVNRTDRDFVFDPKEQVARTSSYPPGPPAPVPSPVPAPPGPPLELGPLAALAGEWSGSGLNCIWRPHFPKEEHDRFLELNLTSETLSFSPIGGEIPNRGLLQADLVMFGLTYLQQISEAGNPAEGLHIEPGVWAVVPQTTDPAEPPSVVRMGSIPHGTTILLQGTAQVAPGAPEIPETNLIPFGLSSAPPPNSEFAKAEAEFGELDLGTETAFRRRAEGVTQAMVEDPNSVLRSATPPGITNTVKLSVSSTAEPIPGGGTANTAFLEGGNADASQVVATFWIETVGEGGSAELWLQYSQTVLLDFNGLHWPHVTVGTLKRKPAQA